jgi:hypothetical protein
MFPGSLFIDRDPLCLPGFTPQIKLTRLPEEGAEFNCAEMVSLD